jgi:hypothetical protein
MDDHIKLVRDKTEISMFTRLDSIKEVTDDHADQTCSTLQRTIQYSV